MFLTEKQISNVINSNPVEALFEFVDGKYITSSTDQDDIDTLNELNEYIGSN